MILKEIVYYLTLSSGLGTKARNILVTLCKHFSVDKKIFGQILFLEKRYNEAYLSSKIQKVNKQKPIGLEDRSERVILCLKKASPFLSLHELLNLGSLGRIYRKELRKFGLREALDRDKMTMAIRVEIYKALVPKRYKVRLADQS